MKQKKIVSMVEVLVLMISALVLAAGCGKVPSKYIGSYSGEWEITVPELHKGSWEGSVDKDGNFSIEIDFGGGQKEKFNAVLSKDGSFSGSKIVGEDKLSFSGNIKGKVVSGTISVDGQQIGKITGKKK